MLNQNIILLIISLLLLNEISFGYILVCRKMRNKRYGYNFHGDCPECPLICRVLSNDMSRPTSFKRPKIGPQTPREKLMEKLRRSKTPKGIYDNKYNPGLWRRTTELTAPYTN
uniref:Hypotheticial protein n=1 Tax=Schistosoma japonicum TaxID=6182 RepID=C1L3T9_SCHJA|nr:hypotheticial protein [Schistosoma japonicum]